MELNIKELVKQHFNLVDADSSVDSTEVKEAFATIKTKDGELTMEYDELEAGKPIFLLDKEGNKVPGPTGMYVLENDKSIRIEDGVIAEVKEVKEMDEEVVRPDRGEETAIEENLSAETPEVEATEEEVEVEASAETDTETEVELAKKDDEEMKDDEDEKMADVPMPVLEELVKQIAAVIEEKLNPMDARIAEMESKVEKMSTEPASTKTIVKSNSSAESFKAETPTARMVMNALSNPKR